MLKPPASNKDKIWTKDFTILICARFCVALIYNALTAVLAGYALLSYTETVSLAGLVVGIFAVGGLFSRPFTAKFTEIIGRKKLLRISSIGLFLFMLLYFIPTGLHGLLIIRFIHGCFWGVVCNTQNVICTALVPKNRLAEGLAFFNVGAMLAMGIGPAIALWFVGIYGYSSLFAVCAGFLLLSLTLISFISVQELELTSLDKQRILSNVSLDDFFERKAIFLSVIAMLTHVVYCSVGTYAASYFSSEGLGEIASYYFLVYSITLIVTRPIMGMIMDRKGDFFVLPEALVFFITGMLILALWHSAAGMLVAAVCNALGIGTLTGVFQTAVVRNVDPNRVSVAFSTYYLLVDTGTGLGPMFLGLVVPVVGFSGMYLCGAGVIVVIGMLLMFYVSHLTKNENS